jgi:hypothetical protein
MNTVRRNLYNIVLLLDMSRPASFAFLVEQILPLISRNMPFRFGLVPLAPAAEQQGLGLYCLVSPTTMDLKQRAAEAITRSMWYLVDAYGRIDAIQFLANVRRYPYSGQSLTCARTARRLRIDTHIVGCARRLHAGGQRGG